ncbi:PP2C family protein-serine/threonine phosphatase [Kineococcus rhizosphaerae]|uniref:Stage II sporulation protein E n=1 Tax=Kineococcus rhizosphaerae TaxID=559628 RepID=A0A2T0R389_9ACTN|nr:PP2C family protein-serine/threonine phosphatase [Kineococcus rhizosphaerae]PRY14527.1 stage II sporulation protein E [Kineococcus rhizosphaerae]
MSLAAEIQRQRLPDAFTCEAGQFTLAAWLEPASTVGGDAFDYVLDGDRLFLSMTDAMGHDVDAAMPATLTVGSLRNSRRADQDLAEMAATAGRAIAEHRSGLGFVTGLLLDVRLDEGTVRVVNAGHPLPLLLRGGRVQPVELQPNLPLGVLPETEYAVQEFALEPGDRRMQERNAHDVDLEGLLVRNADVHPRQLMQILTSAVQEAVEHGPRSTSLADDATALCLQWHGSGGTRRSAAGASSTPR